MNETVINIVHWAPHKSRKYIEQVSNKYDAADSPVSITGNFIWSSQTTVVPHVLIFKRNCIYINFSGWFSFVSIAMFFYLMRVKQ